MLLQYKKNKEDEYINMITPSSYGGDVEDLDSDSYRSVTTGNLIDSVISQSWSKLKLSYKYLNSEQINSMMVILKYNPLYIRAKDPALGNEWVEMEVRCSKKTWNMLEAQKGYTLSFNLVQKTKVGGQ